MRFHLAACMVAVATLGACTQQQQDLATQCGLALYAAKVSTLAELGQVAQQQPACVALGLEAWQAILKEVAAKRGIK